MTSRQGSLELLQEPVAQRLLQSSIPARFAYQWTDGTPRVIPIGFHWNGQEIVLGTPMEAPKLKALLDGQTVALCIDTDTMPCQVLEIRGTIRLDVVEGIGPEYALATLRTMGEEGRPGVADEHGADGPQDDPGVCPPHLGSCHRL